jgi:hypothetical protein
VGVSVGMGFLPHHNEVPCISDCLAILLFRKSPGFCNVQNACWGWLRWFEISRHDWARLVLGKGANGILTYLARIRTRVGTSLINDLRGRQNSSCKYRAGFFETLGIPSGERYQVVVLEIA